MHWNRKVTRVTVLVTTGVPSDHQDSHIDNLSICVWHQVVVWNNTDLLSIGSCEHTAVK